MPDEIHDIALHEQLALPLNEDSSSRWYFYCSCGVGGKLRKSPGAAQRDADGHREVTGTL